MINYLMLALVSSAMILNASEEMINALGSADTEVTTSVVDSAKNFVNGLKAKFVASAAEETVKNVAEVKVVVKPSRFANMINAIKNFKIVEPTKNGVKYVFSLPVDGTVAAWNSSRKAKVIALFALAAIAGGSYAAYNYCQSTAQEADNN